MGTIARILHLLVGEKDPETNVAIARNVLLEQFVNIALTPILKLIFKTIMNVKYISSCNVEFDSSV